MGLPIRTEREATHNDGAGLRQLPTDRTRHIPSARRNPTRPDDRDGRPAHQQVDPALEEEQRRRIRQVKQLMGIPG